jgi:thiamine-monophosphate kinase
LAHLRGVATHPGARGLADDAAVVAWPLGLELVATHDMLAEGVHFTPDCPPADIGWKLAAVNLSDLAAMGAKPVGVLLGAGIGDGRDVAWAKELVRGLMPALGSHGVPLLGGDTVRSGPTSVLALTALGSVPAGAALSRSGGSAGDDLWVSGTIGDAGLGLAIARGAAAPCPVLLKRYRRPTPRLALGLALRGLARACLDVSDGLLLDASRLAAASGCAADIDSALVPLSAEARSRAVPVAQLTAMGDDYELLFAAPASRAAEIEAAAARARTPVTRIGRLGRGEGVTLDGATPAGLGYRHA